MKVVYRNLIPAVLAAVVFFLTLPWIGSIIQAHSLVDCEPIIQFMLGVP